MSTTRRGLFRRGRHDGGASAVEYALILAGVALVGVATLYLLGRTATAAFTNSQNQISTQPAGVLPEVSESGSTGPGTDLGRTHHLERRADHDSSAARPRTSSAAPTTPTTAGRRDRTARQAHHDDRSRAPEESATSRRHADHDAETSGRSPGAAATTATRSCSGPTTTPPSGTVIRSPTSTGSTGTRRTRAPSPSTSRPEPRHVRPARGPRPSSSAGRSRAARRTAAPPGLRPHPRRRRSPPAWSTRCARRRRRRCPAGWSACRRRTPRTPASSTSTSSRTSSLFGREPDEHERPVGLDHLAAAVPLDLEPGEAAVGLGEAHRRGHR